MGGHLVRHIWPVVCAPPGLISLNDWAKAVGTVLHLDLPWRMLRSQLVTLTPDNMLDYQGWFKELSIKEPNVEVNQKEKN